MTKESVYIIDCRRTAIGSANKSLKNFETSELAAFVIDGILEGSKIPKELVCEVVLGNAVSAGTGQNLARKAVYLSDLSITIPAYTVNNVCGSGLQAIILGIQRILVEDAGIVIAGATESATHNPVLINKNNDEQKDSLQWDGLFCSLAEKPMGDICEGLAKEKDISRRKQDEYALESHKRACIARKNGDFKDEIVPVAISGTENFDQDERPREKISLEKLQQLPPVFIEEGSITAGNASSAADGACAFLLASEESMKKNKLVPLAKILGYAAIAVEPSCVFEKGIDAITKCLEKCGLSLVDIDLFEITESFAAQAIFTKESLGIPEDTMNISGGDVALGHPLGIAGARSLVTLIHALKNRKKKRGLVYIPFGAGGAIALAVEV
jgi:acetyl-CoA acetyltransferase family protein